MRQLFTPAWIREVLYDARCSPLRLTDVVGIKTHHLVQRPNYSGLVLGLHLGLTPPIVKIWGLVSARACVSRGVKDLV